MKKIVIIIFTMIAFSCNKEEQQNQNLPSSGTPINFNPEVAESKSGFVGDNFADGDIIGVMGYELIDGIWHNNEFPNLIYNAKLTRIGEDNYSYDPQKMWPNAPSKTRFFAYYPHSSSVAAGAIVPSLETHNGFPNVKVVLGKDVSPVDFLVAQTGVVDNLDNSVTLSFTHKLSKIMFKVKATGLELDPKDGVRKLYINNVIIRNVANKSVYVFDDSGGKWDTNQSGNEDIDATSGATIGFSSVSASIGSSWQDLIDPFGAGSYVLMLPQRYDNVELEIKYTVERVKVDGGCEDHIMSSKKAQLSVNWEASKVYTYYVELAFSEIKEDLLKIGFQVKDWDHINIGTDIN